MVSWNRDHSGALGLLTLLVIHISGEAIGARTTTRPQANTPPELDVHGCKGIRRRRNAQLSSPPNIAGVWFSPRCEIAPGPQYILKHYRFGGDGRFTITRFYYFDEVCSEPAYGIQASGEVIPDGKSWYLKEGTEMLYILSNIKVIPYSQRMVNMLNNIVQMNCKNVTEAWITTSSRHIPISISPQDGLCMEALTFSANELLVMRQVTYGIHQPTQTQSATLTRGHRDLMTPMNTEKELQLGGVWLGQRSRPSSYQPPLYSYSHKHCEACACINRSTFERPPSECTEHLKVMPEETTLDGSWFSDTCESVSNALFTLRSYHYDKATRLFIMKTQYFEDTYCHDSLFTITAHGRYTKMEKHKNLWNTYIYKLSISKLTILPEASHIIRLLNFGNFTLCGHIKDWELSTLYDVSSTRGCDSLGLSYKENEYVLIKHEQHKHRYSLTVSSPKSSGESFYRETTTFEPVLKKCTGEPRHWASDHSESTDIQTAHSNSNTATVSVVILSITLLMVSLVSMA